MKTAQPPRYPAIAQYEDTQALRDQQALRTGVKRNLRDVSWQLIWEQEAVQWLNLYLPRYYWAIARRLEFNQTHPTTRKINSYHAVRVYSRKSASDSSMKWLGLRCAGT